MFRIPRGSVLVVWKSSKKEARTSLSFLMMVPMVQWIVFLDFIQQFNSAFGGEYFEECSKLRHVAMYFQKSARQWWASLRTRGIAPRTWKECKRAIMKQVLTNDAEDNVLSAWQSLTLEPNETIQKYVDKFWDAHLKATIFKTIEFAEQKQQFCTGLLDDLKAYVNAQKPRDYLGFYSSYFGSI